MLSDHMMLYQLTVGIRAKKTRLTGVGGGVNRTWLKEQGYRSEIEGRFKRVELSKLTAINKEVGFIKWN